MHTKLIACFVLVTICCTFQIIVYGLEDYNESFLVLNGVLVDYPQTCTTETVLIPDECIVIGKNSFADNQFIKKVVIPDSVRIIDEFAFSNCSNLATLEIGNNVIFIGDSAFSDCIRLKDLELPMNLLVIGRNAFAWCVCLDRVEIPFETKYIGGGAFAWTGAEVVLQNCSIVYENDSFDGASYILEN